MEASEIARLIDDSAKMADKIITNLDMIHDQLTYRQALQYADSQAAMNEAIVLKHWLALLGAHAK